MGHRRKSTDHGVLILYAIKDHRARIEVGYGLEPILPDGKVGGFQREAIPLMRSGNYNQALLLVTSRVAEVIATDAGIQLTGSQPRAPDSAGAPSRRRSIGRRDHRNHYRHLDYSVYAATQHSFLAAFFSNVRGTRRRFGGGGGGGVRRRWRVRRLWRRQFRRRRSQQQLVASEDEMVPDNKIDDKIHDFVKRAREAAGTNVESIILFGSAVSGDFHPGLSNLNMLCVLRDCSFAALQALAPVAKWWEKQKQPPPLCMTRKELERSTDVFTIELLDMQQHHRVLFGEDVVQGLRISMHVHRVQVEYELREKLILLRQQILLAAGNEFATMGSAAAFGAVVRHPVSPCSDRTWRFVADRETRSRSRLCRSGWDSILPPSSRPWMFANTKLVPRRSTSTIWWLVILRQSRKSPQRSMRR